jgi:hypothetical protein
MIVLGTSLQDNVNYWIVPEGSKVEEKEKLVTIPEHTDAEVLQCPYPLLNSFEKFLFEVFQQILYSSYSKI